ncbi:hypothetical protein CDD83_9577 [Cordyceps sp. RAO-2017]|nr:hypothetical protein CDD83_9577 [Cordyceps sp. RAO-2017]
MALRLLVGACALAGLGAGAASVEKAHVIPDGWQQLADAPDPAQPMRMSLALRHANADGLTSSIRSSLRDGLSLDDVARLRTPEQRDVGSVHRWLAGNGITHARTDKDWVHVHTTVGQAEKLLRTRLHRYSYQGKPAVLRTREYFIPDELAHVVRFVHPVANFMTPEHDVAASRIIDHRPAVVHRRDECSQLITPDCILDAYKMRYKGSDGRSRARLAVAGFLDQFANYADTDQFLGRYAPALAHSGYNFSVELVGGGTNPQDRAKAGSEANLDIQYALAVGYPSHITYYSTGGRGVKLNDSGLPYPEEYSDNEPYLELVEHLLAKPDDELPHVLTMSYADDELSVPRPYAERVCDLFGLLTGRGTSVIVASGDGGAQGGRNAKCQTNDGKARQTAMATFPGTCPWVTAVGAVTNSDSPPHGALFSTGGFSQWFDRPHWQDRAVDGYVEALHGHMQQFYDAKKRAIPDISCVGTHFTTIVGGDEVALDGTSASAPVFAAMIARANDARLRHGKRPLGWLNERLYSDEVRRVLQDTTEGRSKSCTFQTPSGPWTPGGWPAKPGWDAITGLGVPNDFKTFERVLVQGY